MRRFDLKTSFIAIGVLAPGIMLGTSGDALSQQRPLSVSDWLKAERNNANMQRAVEEYERAQFNSVPAQQQTYQQPVRREQALTPDPQAPRRWTPPTDQQAQTPPSVSGELPQRKNEQNTYQVPDDALEKIDKQIEERSGGIGNSATGIYVAANIGWAAIPQQDYGRAGGADFSLLGLHSSGSLGYKFKNGLSLEVEGAYTAADFDESTIGGGASLYSLMANAQYERQIDENTSPYVSIGIGPALYDISGATISNSTSGFNGSNLDGSDLVFAFQIGSGVMYKISENTSLDLGYKLLITSAADIQSDAFSYTADFSSHNFMIGIRHQL